MSGSVDLLHELPPHPAEATYEGLVKVRLAHAQGFSLILPELLFADVGGWAWYQPQFFSACLLSFVDTRASATFTVDLFEGPQFFIDFTKDRLVRHLSDGASIYKCRISGPSSVVSYK